MRFDDDLNACAALVQRGDADRFLAVMAAPVAARAVLFPIYAMNLEVARAPWVTAEPMIAEMRLQWWRDALAEIAAGGPARRHEVITPLARVLPAPAAADLDALVAARRWDIYRDPFADAAALETYLDATAGTLAWAAARALCPEIDAAAEPVIRDAAQAAGVAAWLQAVPDLEARGRIPLVDGTPEGVRALARAGRTRLARARARRGAVPAAARPALLPGWQAGAILDQAIADPGRVARGDLGLSGARKRLMLMLRAASGRW